MDDLPRGFSLPEGSLQRTDDPLIPRKVLREAIVNAVMHRDYRKNSAVHIVRYANRIEIRNPGHSLIGVDQLGAPRSETRNPILANVLHDTGFAETKGTGIEVMRENMRSAGLAPPEFESDRSADHFITTFYLHHFLASQDLDWLGQFKHLNLSEAQVRGLIHAREAGRIDNETYREINGVETLEASQDLRSLRDAGLLAQHERSTATYYEPTEKLLGAAPTGQGEIPFEGTEPDTTQAEGESDQAEEESSTLSEETAQAMGESEQAEQVSPQADLQPLPNELREAVDGLKDKASPETLREVIEQLCQWRPLSAAELAQYLGRGRRYLIHSHVKPMIERGTLERTRPQTPSSPNQKYRVPSADTEG